MPVLLRAGNALLLTNQEETLLSRGFVVLCNDAELMTLWQSMVRVCEPILASKEDAEDCASDALVAAFAAETHAVENREAWLVTVAKRRAMDQLRHRMRSRARLVRMAGHVSHGAPDPADHIADECEAQWLNRRAQEVLAPSARTVLDVVVAGGTVEDAAARLGISRRAAESHLHRARVCLRAAARRDTRP